MEDVEKKLKHKFEITRKGEETNMWRRTKSGRGGWATRRQRSGIDHFKQANSVQGAGGLQVTEEDGFD